MMASEKLAKCMKRMQMALNVARKCRKWLQTSRDLKDDAETLEMAHIASRMADCAAQTLNDAINVISWIISQKTEQDGVNDKVCQSCEKSKVEDIAEAISPQFKGYARYYSPTLHGGEINRWLEVRDVRIDVSDYYEYIDILGLTQEEKEELERKLKESNE